jgi:hypothetical protein
VDEAYDAALALIEESEQQLKDFLQVWCAQAWCDSLYALSQQGCGVVSKGCSDELPAQFREPSAGQQPTTEASQPCSIYMRRMATAVSRQSGQDMF